MPCVKCGAEMPANALICRKCGTLVSKTERKETVFEGPAPVQAPPVRTPSATPTPTSAPTTPFPVAPPAATAAVPDPFAPPAMPAAFTPPATPEPPRKETVFGEGQPGEPAAIWTPPAPANVAAAPPPRKETVFGEGEPPNFGTPGYGAAGYGQPYSQPYVAQKTDSRAIASMVLGICSYALCLSVFTGIPAIILGHLAYSKINRSMGALTGKGFAVAGMVMGYLSFIWLLISMAIVIPNLIRSRLVANEASAVGTIRGIGRAEYAYATLNSGKGYTPDLNELNLTRLKCDTDGTCIVSGYSFVIHADSEVPHKSYVVSAVPIVLNTTGRLGYCALEDGVIHVDDNVAEGKRGYSAEECLALRTH